MESLHWQVEKIIEVAISLQCTGNTDASTGERIAAAFVLNKQEFLCLDMVEAWDLLGKQWQAYVRQIKSNYMHIIDKGR